jgi:hypothetical protein
VIIFACGGEGTDENSIPGKGRHVNHTGVWNGKGSRERDKFRRALASERFCGTTKEDVKKGGEMCKFSAPMNFQGAPEPGEDSFYGFLL